MIWATIDSQSWVFLPPQTWGGWGCHINEASSGEFCGLESEWAGFCKMIWQDTTEHGAYPVSWDAGLPVSRLSLSLNTIQLSYCRLVAFRGHSNISATLNRWDGHSATSEGSLVWCQNRIWHHHPSDRWQQEANPREGGIFFRRIITWSGDHSRGRISDLEIHGSF